MFVCHTVVFTLNTQDVKVKLTNTFTDRISLTPVSFFSFVVLWICWGHCARWWWQGPHPPRPVCLHFLLDDVPYWWQIVPPSISVEAWVQGFYVFCLHQEKSEGRQTEEKGGPPHHNLAQHPQQQLQDGRTEEADRSQQKLMWIERTFTSCVLSVERTVWSKDQDRWVCIVRCLTVKMQSHAFKVDNCIILFWLSSPNHVWSMTDNCGVISNFQSRGHLLCGSSIHTGNKDKDKDAFIGWRNLFHTWWWHKQKITYSTTGPLKINL